MSSAASPQRAHSDARILFPLAPFLESLRADGIRTTLHDYERIQLALRTDGAWTSDRLRNVLSALLVQDQDQEALFRRRFDQFFELPDKEQAGYSEVDVDRALEDLRSLGWEPLVRPERRRNLVGGRIRHVTMARKPRVMTWVLAGVLCSIVTGLILLKSWTDEPIVLPPPVLLPTLPPTLPPPALPPPTESLPKVGDVDEVVLKATIRVPIVSDLREVRSPRFDAWKRPALLSAALLLAFLGYGVWLRQVRRPLRDEVPPLDPDGPRLFRTGTIGGDPAPRLDAATLDVLADALGYFRSEETGSKLDVERSIAAAGRKGGIPQLIFEQRKRVRSVVVLEDILAEPANWNPIARELSRGLERRGVSVLYGRFRGCPERFVTADGSEFELEDLEDDRQGYLLLIFSDGKALRHDRDRFALEVLSRWPWVAWMELRERRAWDACTAWPSRCGLPLYPASREGLLRVLGRFTAEHSSQGDGSRGREDWQGAPSGPSSRLAEHDLERLLGDALPWAQNCSMMTPPLSLGLADGLRREFHPELPPERIERILTLPGTIWCHGGLRFSMHLLALLRRGFLKRNGAERQLKVLEHLVAEVRLAEPLTKDSLEHHAWEWRLERLRLEVEPDQALKRLSTLTKGPLRSAVRGDLRRAGQGGVDEASIPLRAMPKTLQGRIRLEELRGVTPEDSERVGGWYRAVMIVLGLSSLMAAVWASWLVVTVPDTVILQLASEIEAPVGRLSIETSRAGRWEPFETVDLGLSTTFTLQRGQEYRIQLAGSGQKPTPTNTRRLEAVKQDLVLIVGAESQNRMVAMKFRYVPPGKFRMGSPGDEPGRDRDEMLHDVELTRGFWIGETEVTQGQWESLMGRNPSYFTNCGSDCPVENVNWYEAVELANRLSDGAALPRCYEMSQCNGVIGRDFVCDTVKSEGLDCRGYRLPTEAEWEHAARAGTNTAISTGELTVIGANNGPELDVIAWYGGNSGVDYIGGSDCGKWEDKQYADQVRCGPHPVGEKEPNRWGLSDMLGNVMEWTWDRYEVFWKNPKIDPTGHDSNKSRVIHGGNWGSFAHESRIASRDDWHPRGRDSRVGFRLVRPAG